MKVECVGCRYRRNSWGEAYETGGEVEGVVEVGLEGCGALKMEVARIVRMERVAGVPRVFQKESKSGSGLEFDVEDRKDDRRGSGSSARTERSWK